MAAPQVRVGIKVAQMTGLYDDAKEAWLEADRLGFDTGWLHDHLLNQNDLSAPEEEGWSILAALLALSKSIRGGLLVTSNTFRHPSLLAKIATTIDRISGGRVEVGLGAGWMEAEHEQYGITLPPLKDRVRALDEACQILISLWTQERTTFNGQYYTLKEAYHEPKAIQNPHPPLVIGAKGEKVTLRTTARYAAEWNYSGGTPEEFAHKSAVLDEHCRAIGRDPKTIERSTQFRAGASAAELLDLSRQYIGRGATHLIYTCPQPYSAKGARWIWNEVVMPLRG
ncbi:MAG: LLM class F420-dependent oxidoreductase [Chloroflexi bacterium]|nr:LLM class F420-dependent oxidoreductase [Chloroflexota bacterium]